MSEIAAYNPSKNFKQQNSWEYEYESVENQPLMGIIGIYGVQYNTFLYMFFTKQLVLLSGDG